MRCAIDTETSGADFEIDTIVQLGIVPLDIHYNPTGDNLLLDIEPVHVTRESKQVKESRRFGLTEEVAIERFQHWYEGLGLNPYERLIPIGHNFIRFDEVFLRKMFGEMTYSHYFDIRVIDTMVLAKFINDVDEFKGEHGRFKNVKLGTVARGLGVEYDESLAHDALYDADVTCQIYRKLLNDGLLAFGRSN